MAYPIPRLSDLRGLWQRSLIAWPDGARDTATDVRWLQGLELYIDLRRPASPPDFSHARGLADLSVDDCLWLARQEGFAGHFTFDGTFFEWARSIDFQPKPLYSDAGSLWWEDDVLVETGRDIAYIEHWRRDEATATSPTVAVALRDIRLGIKGALLRVGPLFMFARDRTVVPSAQQTLSQCVKDAHSLEDARALVDCEISFGRVGPAGFQIATSSLPYRTGDLLGQSRANSTLTTIDRAPNGEPMIRRWEITECEGDISALDAAVLAVAEP